ncbi:MAG: glycosyltransferase family 2 protein [bacterium]
MTDPEISVILPCRNEEEALGGCISAIKDVLKKHRITGEIIVSDSSTDRSPDIARELGVILVKHDREGYGIAYLEAFKAATGRYVFCADPDGTYDFREIPDFINCLREGYDFVIGNRFKGKIAKRAMPWSHRYIGNPLLSFILKIFFKTEISDSHCGMRALSMEALNKLKLKTSGMEFASEMVIKAIKKNLKTKELPINYYERKGKSKLRSLADGWRHLRFMLLYSPLFLFFLPGLLLFLLGSLSMLWLYFGSASILGIKLFYHPMFLSSVLVITGYQIMIFSLFAKTYAITHLDENSPAFQSVYRYITIEKAGILGMLLTLLGVTIYAAVFVKWLSSGLGALQEVKISIVALTLIAVGAQTIFSSFMLSILGIK